MGIYLVDVSRESWAADETRVELDRALAGRGLPPYAGPPADLKDHERFEEKVAPSMDAFAELCDRHGATDLLEAGLFVPVPFDGLIELPVETSYDDVTRACSSHRLRELMRPLATEVPRSGKTEDGPMRLTAALADGDPVTFYVALFTRAAEFSLRHCCPMQYI